MKRVELFLRHVERIGGFTPEYHVLSEAGDSLAAVVVFQGVPQEGALTSFSYGLSLFSNPKWVKSRPELVLSVDSTDIGWALAPGELVRRSEGRVAVSYGSVLEFGGQIAPDSEMSSFVVFACASLESEDLVVRLPIADVQFVQLYPIYSAEARTVERIGAERFIRELGELAFSVTRAPVLV